MSEENREQVVDQCKAVAHLATALARINEDYAKMFAAGDAGNIIEMVGERTARHIEALGDILNGMDAATEEDDWINPIFEEAQRLWPSNNENDSEGKA